jgi:AraC-like DNA-binding protein
VKEQELEVLRSKFVEAMAMESQFHRVFDGLPDMHFYAKNLKGQILFCSRFLHVHLGRKSPNDILGKTDHELTPGPLAESYVQQDQIIIRTNAALPPEMVIWMDEVGLPEFFESHKYPVCDRNGEVIGIMGILRATGNLQVPVSIHPSIRPVFARLQESLDQFPSLEELSDIAGISVRQFQRIFKQSTASSPYQYWMKLRIRSACRRIRQGEITLISLAIQLGFSDQSSFTQQFKKHTGKTPGQYSRLFREHEA